MIPINESHLVIGVGAAIALSVAVAGNLIKARLRPQTHNVILTAQVVNAMQGKLSADHLARLTDVLKHWRSTISYEMSFSYEFHGELRGFFMLWPEDSFDEELREHMSRYKINPALPTIAVMDFRLPEE